MSCDFQNEQIFAYMHPTHLLFRLQKYVRDPYFRKSIFFCKIYHNNFLALVLVAPLVAYKALNLEMFFRHTFLYLIVTASQFLMFRRTIKLNKFYPANIYLFKVNNRNTKRTNQSVRLTLFSLSL